MHPSIRPAAFAALPALLLLLLAGVPAAGQTPADQAPPAGTAGEAFADVHSVTELARTARGLRLGDRLHLEGLELEPPGGGPGADRVGLDLERFRVFAPDGTVVIHGRDGDEELPFPDNAYFRGRVVGEPDSLAVLTVLEPGAEEGPVRGLVQRHGALWVIGGDSPHADGSRGLAARRVEAPEDPAAAGFDCQLDEVGGLAAPGLTATGATTDGSTTESTSESGGGGLDSITGASFTTTYSARVAVETDYELFQLFGSEAALTDYVGDLFAYASSVYDAETGTDLQVTHLSVWGTSSDPWTQTGSLCALFELGRYWNDNRTTVERTLTHFLSGKSNKAGIAWVGVLCSGQFPSDHGGGCPELSPSFDNYGGAYGFTGGIDGNFDLQNPSVVWDIVGMSHEIGHNFDSPHTHCYEGIGGSSEAVDHCYGSQTGTGCYAGDASLPGPAGEGSGTIMSYCHLIGPDYMANLSPTFGTGHGYGVLPQRVPDRMRAHVEETAALAPACLERIDGGGGDCGDELILSNETVSTTETYETCGTLTAGSGFEVVSPGDVTLRGGTVVLADGFSVGSGASLRVEIQ